MIRRRAQNTQAKYMFRLKNAPGARARSTPNTPAPIALTADCTYNAYVNLLNRGQFLSVVTTVLR